MKGESQTVQFNPKREEVLIGITSDTHISKERAKSFPAKVKEIFKKVDLIIHAGDIGSLEVIKELEKIAPVFAIQGNHRSTDHSEIKEKLPEVICLKVNQWKIGIIHNPSFPWLRWKMEKIAKKNNLDVLIFGHTHRPFLRKRSPLLINPGSPTYPFLARASVAILKITKNSYQGKIIYLS